MYSASAPDVEAAERLLYRNGFILSEAAISGYPFAGWHVHRLGDLVLQTHPDACCVVETSHGLTSALIGDAFDPECGVYDEAGVLQDLVKAKTEPDFHRVLDRLGGRFALLLARHDGYQVFQDAIGARTVFYATNRRIAASHAEIVAKASGSGFSDFFIPFLTSRNYVRKDVKYLPGIATPYENVLQLTPNTRLDFADQKVTRFWPREPISAPSTDAAALDGLLLHVRGLATYLRAKSLRPLAGLTAGTDSRLLLAAFRSSDPYLFTYIRSDSGTTENDVDTRQAAVLAGRYGLTRDVYPIPNRPALEDAGDAFSYAFRRSTGYFRSSTSLWPKQLADQGFEFGSVRCVRGFGGEVLRGFYQGTKNQIDRVNHRQLSRAYDINSGSSVTRNLFLNFMETACFDDASLHGRNANDIFYWEHRMGIWGSIALAEADLAVPMLAGYNSRNLFDLFLALPWENRKARTAFHQATRQLAPLLLDEISSEM